MLKVLPRKTSNKSKLSGEQPDTEETITDFPLWWIHRAVNAGRASARLIPGLLCYAGPEYGERFKVRQRHLAGWGVDIATVRHGLRLMRKARLIKIESGIGKQISVITLLFDGYGTETDRQKAKENGNENE